MPEEDEFATDAVKLHLLHNAKCILAISIWMEPEAKVCADALGAKVLLDKARLYSKLTDSIKSLCYSKQP
jgi:hypothetical protein